MSYRCARIVVGIVVVYMGVVLISHCVTDTTNKVQHCMFQGIVADTVLVSRHALAVMMRLAVGN